VRETTVTVIKSDEEMKKIVIAAAAAVVGALFGAYIDKKYNLDVKGRVDRAYGKCTAGNAETTTGNDSASSTEASSAS